MLRTFRDRMAICHTEDGQSYRGWIPCVSGRLSFSVFGRTLHPTKAVWENLADHQLRYLLVFQRRNLSDAMIPSKGIDARFVFVFIANTIQGKVRNQEYLIGKSFIFSDNRAWSSIEKMLRSYQNDMRSFRTNSHAGVDPDLTSFIRNREGALIVSLESSAEFSADVCICRTGTVDLKADLAILDKSGTPNLPSEHLLKNARLRTISAQIFFFLKDIGHTHQHHDSSTDTITDIHSFDGTPQGDLSWRCNTLYNIYRKVIEYKRNPHASTFNDCLGLIAYADTFRGICEEELGIHKQQPPLKSGLPVYYSNQIEQSISATQEKHERILLENRYRADIVRNFIIAIVGVIISYLGLMQFAEIDKIKASPWLVSILHLIIISPQYVIISLICMIIVYFQIHFRVFNIINDGYLIRLLSSFPRQVVIAVISIVGFMMLLVALWVMPI
jgi:hypothetical protein